MLKLIITIFIIFLLASAAAGQNCETVEDCNAKLSDAAKMINKLLDVSAAQKDAILALKEENASRQRKNDIDAGTVIAQDKLIALHEKRKGTTISFLWGLIKIRKN